LEITNITFFFPAELLSNNELVPDIKTPLTSVASKIVVEQFQRGLSKSCICTASSCKKSGYQL